MLNILIHSRQLFNALIPSWLMSGRVAHVVVHLVTLDCTCRLTRTVDIVVDIGNKSASVEQVTLDC